MRTFIIGAFILFLSTFLPAQSITQAEYFIDVDPGVGLGIAIPISQGAGDVTLDFFANTSGLTSGFHQIYFRVKSGDDWSLTAHHSFYLFSESAANVSKLEYFIDEDPGVGQGNEIVFSNSNDIDAIIDLSNIASGFHQIYFRSFAPGYGWSLTGHKSFYALSAEPGSFARLEYFIDEDPGFGQGVELDISGTEAELTPIISLDGLTTGFHQLFVRTQSSSGQWSYVSHRPFYVVSSNSNSPISVIKYRYLKGEEEIASYESPVSSPSPELDETFMPPVDDLERGETYKFCATVQTEEGVSSQEVCEEFQYGESSSELQALAIEINQAVQTRIFDLDPNLLGTSKTVALDLDNGVDVPIVPHKPTLVRYYVVGNGGSIGEVSGSIRFNAYKNQELITTEVISPNVAGLDRVINISEKPATEAEIQILKLEQRIDLSKTLNFVISREIFPLDTEEIEIVLVDNEREISQRLRLILSPPISLGVIYRKITERAELLEDSGIRSKISEFTKGAYPISEFQDHQPIINTRVEIGRHTNSNKAKKFLRAFRRTVSNRDLYNYPSNYPVRNIYMGILDPEDLIGANSGWGLVPIASWTLNLKRFNVCIAQNLGVTGAHEIGHLMGLFHAGRVHGEGANSENFPANGALRLSSDPLIADFGVALSSSNNDQSKWMVYWIDPCPNTPAEQRNNCSAGITHFSPNPRPFDLMSYARPDGFHPQYYNGVSHTFPFSNSVSINANTIAKRWISSLNYTRIYKSIMNGELPDILRNTQNSERVQVLSLSGFLSDNSVTDFLVLRQIVTEDELEQIPINEEALFQIQLLNDDEQIIYDDVFEPNILPDANEESYEFEVFVPESISFDRIKIKNPEGITIYNQVISPNKPSATLITPLAGENLRESIYTLEWEANDFDGDTLTHLISYSPNMGKDWYPVAYLEDTIMNKIEIDISWLPQGDSAIFQISSSDGLQPSVAVSNQTFCVRSNGICTPIEVTTDSLGNVITSIDHRWDMFKLDISPNPFTSEVEVSLSLSQPSEIEISLHDVLGRKIQEVSPYNHLDKGLHRFVLSGSNLAPGVYLLNISSKKNHIVRKLVKR